MNDGMDTAISMEKQADLLAAFTKRAIRWFLPVSIIVAVALGFFTSHMNSTEKSFSLSTGFPTPYDSFFGEHAFHITMVLFVVIVYLAFIVTPEKNPFTAYIAIYVGLLLLIPFLVVAAEKSKISKELISKQHVWAEQRYGIEYDSITTYKVGSRHPTTTYQDKVMKNGHIIAEVCPRQGSLIYFCIPYTDDELPATQE